MRTVLAVLLLVAGTIAPALPALAATGSTAPSVPGELLVQFEPGSTRAERARARDRLGVTKLWDLPAADVELVLTGDHATPPAEQARRALLNGHVRHAQPNYLWTHTTLPDDPELAALWGLHNTGQTGGTPDADIDAPEAWGVVPPSDQTVVAVIDTGVAADHPDLAGSAWHNTVEVKNCLDDDGNGYADDLGGWDFYNHDETVFDASDGDVHGTHVAGTIAATKNNAVAVAGVSAARLMPLKFLGPDGTGDTAGAIAAIDYAIANGADVINASWGGAADDSLLEAKIAEAGSAGILFVAAAGNDGVSAPHYPAAYAASLDNVVSVAATTSTDLLAPFSNHGPTVTMAAPGQAIVSTVPVAPGTATSSGTSMAAPHVAGAAAVVAAAYPTLGHLGVKQRLLAGADQLPALLDLVASGRRLNVAGAVDSPGGPHAVGLAASVAGDTVTLRWTQEEPATATVTVLPAGGGTAVARDDVGPRAAGAQQWEWRAAPAGSYSIEVALRDVRANATTTAVAATVGTSSLPPEPAPEPKPEPDPEPEPAPAPVPKPAPAPAPAPAPSGYWMLGANGAVYAFGGAGHAGNATLPAASADIEGTPDKAGYWVVDAAGYVAAFGTARHHGGLNGALGGGEAVTAMSATPRGNGYWLFTSHGRAVPFGGAGFYGDMSGVPLNGPVLDSVATPSGRGYYMVASDGGIFAFGDAAFHGSMGGIPLNAPVQSLVPDADRSGYWLVAADGGIFAFGAPFYGSMGGAPLNRPVTGMVASGGAGYLMVAADGGIFAFGAAPFHGSLGASPPTAPIVAVAVL